MDMKNDFQYEEENNMGTDYQYAAQNLWVETYITALKQFNHKQAIQYANEAVDAFLNKLKEV